MPRADFDAVVHSVFQSAINLRPANGDELLTLVASGEADLPQGIRVDTPEDFSFEIFSMGEQAVCRDNILRLDTLTMDLHRARHWKCDLPALKFDPTNPAVASAWSFVWNALNEQQIESNAEIIADNICYCDRRPAPRSNPLISSDSTANPREEIASRSSQRHHPTILSNVSRNAGEAMRDLVVATQRYDLTDTSSIKSLIGLGIGLTPSGDDLLVGYLAGLWCTVHNISERLQFISDLGREVIRCSTQTNDISRTYLYHAAHGQVSSLLMNLAEAICHGDNPDRLLVAAEFAMQVGHTSGMDAVTGLLLGLTAWVSPEESICTDAIM